MRTFERSILFSATLALAAAGVSAAQPTNDSFEQWHKAKFGRYSAREEARQKAERENAAFREETPRKATVEQANEWFHDQWYRAKYGRSSPGEEKRLKAEEENAAFREEPTRNAAPAPTWLEQWYKAKYGRSLPGK